MSDKVRGIVNSLVRFLPRNRSQIARVSGTKDINTGVKYNQNIILDVATIVAEEQLANNNMVKALEGEVCRMEDSPFRILKVAASGNLREFERLYNEDNSRMTLRDSRGQTVIHHAASKSKVNILTFIVDGGGDVDVQDDSGNTPLHVSVEKDQVKGATFLLEHGAQVSIRNNKGISPTHAAVATGHYKILEALLAKVPELVDERDEAGCTPLHHVASTDCQPCAAVLVKFKANLMARCHLGFTPVSLAAQSGSHKVLEIILLNAKVGGTSEVDLLSVVDRGKRQPLHAAVNSGSLEGVNVCLKYGAPIESTKQDDYSTPVHAAVGQGRMDMVVSMLDERPDHVTLVLQSTDVLGRTVLHVAALYNQEQIVAYLLKKGANIDDQDKDGRTALLLAASKQGWRTVKLLLSQNADMSVKDNRSRNFLHLAIINSARLCNFGQQFFEVFKGLLNQKDDLGCTPLHYATQEGHLSAIDDLITLGAFLNIKNNKKQSPLHFAAKYGRLNTCYRLLGSAEGPHIINETDGEGLTAIHIAAQNGNAKVVECLLQKGAALQRDNAGNTPLHFAAYGYTQTIKVILSVHKHILNAKNSKGETALHIAAREGQTLVVSLLMTLNADFTLDEYGFHFLDYAILSSHKEVAIAIISHDRWREAMSLESGINAPPMIELIKHLPDVCLSVLDLCQFKSSGDPKGEGSYYHYDFQYLRSGEETRSGQDHVSVKPMYALNMMVKYNRVECLSHPVSVTYLKMKWRAYGMWIYTANIIIYLLYLGILTSYVVMLDPNHHVRHVPVYNETDTSTNASFMENISKSDGYHPSEIITTFGPFHMFGMSTITLYCMANILKEFVQMYQQGSKYFYDFHNVLEWCLYASSLIFIMPTALGILTHEQWEAATIAIFLAWFNFLLNLQKFDFFGIYVVMFLEILKTLVRVVIVFSILIIAFGLAFYILLCGETTPANRTPLLSLVRTFIMMLGEIDYIPIFLVPSHTSSHPVQMHYGDLTYVLLIIFVLLMPILLMNLLIGLAVGDIESVQRNARLKRLAKQVELHTDLEGKLPRKILKMVDKKELNVYTSYGGNFSWILGRFFRADESDHESKLGPRSETFSAEYHAMNEEMQRQKKRLKDLSLTMEKQHDLLRLVVQKMEIRSEADVRDVGDVSTAGGTPGSDRWSTRPVQKKALPRQENSIKKWNQV